MRRSILTWGLCGLAVQAQAAVWDCRIIENTKQQNLSPVLIIEFDDGRDMVNVVDTFTYNEGRPPNKGVITSRADGRIKFEWTAASPAHTTDFSTLRIQLQYIGIFDPARRSLSVRAYPAGFDNEFYARGPCTLLQP